MISFLPSVSHYRLLQIIIFMLFICVVVITYFIFVVRKVMMQYNNMEVQNKVLQRDLELNAIIKHEYIQKILCPHDLLTFNNEHIYIVDKCSNCNKQCKRECWTQYYIDKLNKEREEI
jgi:hypothetical protein